LSKKKLQPYTVSAPYRDFKRQNDTALEKIVHVHLSAVDQIIGKMKKKILAFITQQHVEAAFRAHATGPIKQELMLAAIQTATIVRRQRAEAYLLAHAGQAEAMARAKNEPTTSHPKVKAHKDKEMFGGGDVYDRMKLNFGRLGRKIQDALELSHVVGESPIKRVTNAFPKTRDIKATPALRRRKTKESDVPGVAPMQWVPKLSTGITDEDAWNDILIDYNSSTLPDDIYARGPEDKTLFYDVEADAQAERYTWEVEQEITEDFVRSVRSGEQDAANENGITDFMWIAVVDNKTDECCYDRDGLSSSEIEDAMASGKIDEDECDAIVAPGHFNCRCQSVPMDSDIPETQPVDFSDYDQWLEDKANS